MFFLQAIFGVCFLLFEAHLLRKVGGLLRKILWSAIF